MQLRKDISSSEIGRKLVRIRMNLGKIVDVSIGWNLINITCWK